MRTQKTPPAVEARLEEEYRQREDDLVFATVDDIKTINPCITLRTLNYGNHGLFLVGNGRHININKQ